MSLFKPHQSDQAPLEPESSALPHLSKQFWSLQIAGWLGYAAVVFLAIIQPQFDSPGFNLPGQVLNLSVESLSGFLLSYLQWLFIRKIIHQPLQRTLVISFLSAALLGLIYNIIKLASYKVIVHDQHWNQAWNMLEFGGWLLFSLTTMFVWTSIFFIMLYNSRLQKEHERLLRAQTQAKDAQLQMLRYQLNPHFMFNTMNAISTLILKEDNDTASEMLDKLCDFFRHSLEATQRSRISLQEEVQLIELYLAIEKVRFGQRLSVRYAIEPEVQKALVPNMLCQPVVENAIKYAIEPSKQGGEVSILAKQRAKQLVIEISDSGTGGNAMTEKGFGIGLNNAKSRLDMMYSGNFTVSLNKNAAGGNTVTLVLPYEVD
ncbi:sensor histidine kinase [Pseudoalteromonas sp. R3]|uniref:sensor histidine kinase n=1 Tax=Pseudoalteromonas sp. R3 TaxID=1709477 RepID=UPI0006B40186|nr:histidine kinase [Pseudoalteromonas sp. R3]